MTIPNLSKKQVIMLMISAIISLLNILALFFTLAKIDLSFLGTTKTVTINGFSIMESYPEFLEESGGWLSTFSIIYLLISLSIIAILVFCFLKKSIDTFFNTAVKTNLISLGLSFIYLINGTSVVSKAKETIEEFGNVSSASYIPFILILVLVIAYIISDKYLDKLLDTNTVFSTQKKANSASNADELIKYKDLLDKGIITQEEFDAKKKQLFDL